MYDKLKIINNAIEILVLLLTITELSDIEKNLLIEKLNKELIVKYLEKR